MKLLQQKKSLPKNYKLQPTSYQLTSLADFVPELSAELIISEGSEKIVIVDRITSSKIILKEGAKLTFVFFGTEGWEDVAKLTFELSGRESELKFLGFIVGTEKNSFPFETISRHIVPQTKAHYWLKAAMFDHSVVDYKGNILIEKAAQLTDSYLAHHTLLLSDFARARTIPALEIEADDVKAGHAATIGKVDEETMFYMQSRGIDSKQAELMLISGFFEKELQMIDDSQVQEVLRKAFQEALLKAEPMANINLL